MVTLVRRKELQRLNQFQLALRIRIRRLEPQKLTLFQRK